MLDIFLSYCPEDEELRAKLEKHLAVLEREGDIGLWHDQKITAGDEWARQINDKLRAARIILILISPDFLASTKLWERDVSFALERHENGETRVIPVILRPADWEETSLARFEALPKDGKPVTSWQDPDVALLQVAQGIRAVVEEERRRPRPPHEKRISELESILAGFVVPDEEIDVLHRRHAPPDWQALVGDPGDRLGAAVRSLVQALWQSDGKLPILRFVEDLIQGADRRSRKTLQQWHEETKAQCAVEIEPAKLKDSLQVGRDDEQETVYLQVKIEQPPPIEPRAHDTFTVNAWLNGSSHSRYLLSGETYPRARLKELLDRLRQEVKGIHSDRVWVELMLPRELLCSDVDQWQVQRDRRGRGPAGEVYPLLVRPLENTVDPDATRYLKQRWRKLQAQAPGGCEVAGSLTQAADADHLVACLGRGCERGQKLYYRLLEDARSLACVVLEKAPAAKPETGDVLDALLDAGLGVILWARSDAGQEESATIALTDLVRNGINELPQKVRTLRRKVITESRDLGRHITLLWDDPTRPFPAFDRSNRLVAPVQRGVSR